MPLEMLTTLWTIEYSEKNPIKKLYFEISFNYLQNRSITIFLTDFYTEIKNQICLGLSLQIQPDLPRVCLSFKFFTGTILLRKMRISKAGFCELNSI